MKHEPLLQATSPARTRTIFSRTSLARISSADDCATGRVASSTCRTAVRETPIAGLFVPPSTHHEHTVAQRLGVQGRVADTVVKCKPHTVDIGDLGLRATATSAAAGRCRRNSAARLLESRSQVGLRLVVVVKEARVAVDVLVHSLAYNLSGTQGVTRSTSSAPAQWSAAHLIAGQNLQVGAELCALRALHTVRRPHLLRA